MASRLAMCRMVAAPNRASTTPTMRGKFTALV